MEATGESCTAQLLAVGHQNISKLLQHWAKTRPDKTFLIWEPFEGHSQQWSYSEFHNGVIKIASSLYALGLRENDKILIHSENSPEFLLSWFASAYLGAVAVTTNTNSVASDLDYFIEHSGIKAAIIQDKFSGLLQRSSKQLEFTVIYGAALDHKQKPTLATQLLESQELLDADPPAAPEPELNAIHDLCIQYTSGTTSRPKAVLWTHANALFGAQANCQHFRLKDDARCLVFLPLFHTNVLSYSMLSTLWVGGTMVLQPRFSASRFWEVSLRHECNWSSMIPFCLKALFEQSIPEQHHYELWVTAVRLTIAEELFKVKTLGLWGMTETISQGIVADYNYLGPDMGIGRASTSYEIAIKTESGADVKPGERGRLYIRGTRGISLFKEYYRTPEATAKSFDEQGWFDTGDIVRIDENGDLFFADRDKDMLKVGGENVAASEIESVIMASGLVSECAVVA